MAQQSVLERIKKMITQLDPISQGYVALAIGIFLLLFSVGYFEFLKILIALIGFALIVWGTTTSKLPQTITYWINSLRKK